MCGILFQRLPGSSEPSTAQFTNEPSIANLIRSLLLGSLPTDDLQSLRSITLEFRSLVPKILARGPNYGGYRCLNAKHSDLHFFSSVLSLRSPFTAQPRSNPGFVLQFNGELYNQLDANDTQYLETKLLSINHPPELFSSRLVDLVRTLEGEFAFSVYHVATNTLFFARDLFGKRLLVYKDSPDNFLLSSIGSLQEGWIDCKGGTVYSAQFSDKVDIQELAQIGIPPVSDTVRVRTIQEHVDSYLDILTQSTRNRITTIHPLHSEESSGEYVPPQDLTKIYENPVPVPATNSKFAVLFSGGIDCTVIAALAAEASPAGTGIDLLNVSFENRRTSTSFSDTPDRKLGRVSWRGLQAKYPHVKFNFIEVDVAYAEYLVGREITLDLMLPLLTEMDLSIAVAFFFASRGWGTNVTTSPPQTAYSNCKVLLSGLGADELFGGYSRHDRVFKQQENKEIAYKLLDSELSKDIGGIWKRNLSRDDKVMGSWGKEVRYPFLSLQSVEYAVCHVPTDLKVRIEGENIVKKYLLRQVAQVIGLDWVVNEAKRAIQFGAKSAKMNPGDGRIKGRDKVASDRVTGTL